METFLYLMAAAFLILLNAFFVLAEFASVKVRPTQIQVMASEGNKGAVRAQKILHKLDLYLSVSQVGITVASIGLGFVGEPAFAHLLFPVVNLFVTGHEAELVAHAAAIFLSFVVVSFLHIVLGELLPKSIALRSPEKSIIFISWPMIVFRVMFAFPIWFLNATVNILLRLLRFPINAEHKAHSEGEIRAILDHSETSGILSFRALLCLENVLDFGDLTVRNAMRVKKNVRSVPLSADLEGVREIIRQSKHSRYPVLSAAGEPLGFIHLKDLYFAPTDATLESLVKPALQVFEKDPLEKVMTVMQRKGQHMAFVYSAPKLWTGIITLEDVIEEVIGTIEEEYPVDPVANLADFLTPAHVVLDVEGATIVEAVSDGLGKVHPHLLPHSREAILKAVTDRERLGSSFMGHNLAIPHARLERISNPSVFLFRLKEPIPAPTGKEGETIRILFLLITPATSPRIHQLLLSHIGGIYDSDYLETRLEEGETPEELYETVTTAEQMALA